MGALDTLQTWAKRTYRGADWESALDQITISDDAGECGNRRIGKACSAHLRNSRTDRKHMVSPKWDNNRLVAAIGYMPHTKSQRDVSGAADKHDRLRLSDPNVRGLQAATG